MCWCCLLVFMLIVFLLVVANNQPSGVPYTSSIAIGLRTRCGLRASLVNQLLVLSLLYVEDATQIKNGFPFFTEFRPAQALPAQVWAAGRPASAATAP